jgi:NifB/MoaA-like Fe-S oxidoreductase
MEPKIMVYEIKNNFFGHGITVSGLLTGKDIMAQLKGKIETEVLFIPLNAFKSNETIMLDDTSIYALENILGVKIIIGSTNGGEFAKQLMDL